MMCISRLSTHVAAVVVLSGLMSLPVCAGEVSAAVASNFSAPMLQIAGMFQKESGHTVKLIFGSTGGFYAQVREGAPFDVFVAADSATPQRLEEEGYAVVGSRFVYALGKLVLWSAQPGYVDEHGIAQWPLQATGHRGSQTSAIREGGKGDAGCIEIVAYREKQTGDR